MPTTDVTNTLVANLTSTEQSTSNVPINRSTGNPAFNCNVGIFLTYFALAAGVNNVLLPTPVVYQAYFRNLDAAKNLTVSWGVNGGGGNNPIITLLPGDQIIYWGNPSGAGASGLTSISITPSAAGCLMEYFLGG